MTTQKMQIKTVSGGQVKRGDVISLGGIPLMVVDIRYVSQSRKRIDFSDGNWVILGASKGIEVTRPDAPPPRARVRTTRARP